jgi:hypothetical protein
MFFLRALWQMAAMPDRWGAIAYLDQVGLDIETVA